MLRIFIASHGSIASGMKSSLDILLGKSDNVTVFDAYLDERNLKDELEKYFQSIPESDQVIMVSDLYGGSVNQIMYLFLSRPDTYLVAGMNLALIIDLALLTESIDANRLSNIVLQNKEALRLVEPTTTPTREDDFFEVSND